MVIAFSKHRRSQLLLVTPFRITSVDYDVDVDTIPIEIDVDMPDVEIDGDVLMEVDVDIHDIEVELDGPGGFMALKTFIIKRGDTQPSLRIRAKENGAPYDLTGATATFLMNDCDGNVKVAKSAVIESPPTSGIIRYDWVADDTDTAEDYKGEFAVSLSGGGKITFPINGFIPISVIEDLNET